jgi:hypothetical protein
MDTSDDQTGYLEVLQFWLQNLHMRTTTLNLKLH